MKNYLLALVVLCTVTACGGGSSSGGAGSAATDSSASDSSATDTSTTDSSSGVDAGYGRVVVAGDSVTLNATVADGDIHWRQLSGPSVSLSDATVEDPSFTAPSVGERTQLVFELSVDNGTDIATDQVTVEVWVGADSSSDKTVLGDFSGRDGWACDRDPVAEPTVTVTRYSSVINYTSNGIPAHTTGTFPNGGNPNTITQISDVYDIPANPVKLGYTTDMAVNGITLDGVPMERDTAESYHNANQWHYEAITPGIAAGRYEWDWLGTDCNNAHVQPNGQYHYHGLMEAYLNEHLGKDGVATDMVLGGYAADGFPIYLRYGHVDPNDPDSGLQVMKGSWELKAGTRPDGPGGNYDGTFVEDWEYVAGSGDLDECNGRFGVTPEYPDGIYHYYITDDYPYIARCVHGQPDSSFRLYRH